MAWACENAGGQDSCEDILARTVVFNLDTDQVPTTAFWQQVQQEVLEKQLAGVPAAMPRRLLNTVGCLQSKKHGDRTGRVGALADEFLAICGYDEEENVAPSGFQDVDIARRLWLCRNVEAIYIDQGDGISAPNDENALLERNDAKIRLCGDALDKWTDWSAMNLHNRGVMRKKKGYVRNVNGDVAGWANRSVEQRKAYFVAMATQHGQWEFVSTQEVAAQYLFLGFLCEVTRF